MALEGAGPSLARKCPVPLARASQAGDTNQKKSAFLLVFADVLCWVVAVLWTSEPSRPTCHSEKFPKPPGLPFAVLLFCHLLWCREDCELWQLERTAPSLRLGLSFPGSTGTMLPCGLALAWPIQVSIPGRRRPDLALGAALPQLCPPAFGP